MFTEVGYRIAKVGNAILGVVAGIIILVAFTFGTYSLWDIYMTNQGAFVPSEILKYKPASTSAGDNLTLGELKNVNNEAVAWIAVRDTHIDYPIVQGVDNAKYVNTDIYGEFSLSGSIFLSYENEGDFSDSYNVLFGHHMANGGMFGDVSEFMKRKFFDAHRWGILFTENETYDVHFFAVMYTVAYDYEVYYPKKYKEAENVPKLLSYVKDKSSIFEDVGFEGDNKIVALSTCEDAATNGRTVLFGKMIKRIPGVDNPEVPKYDDSEKDTASKYVLGAHSEKIRYLALFNLGCVVVILIIAVYMLLNKKGKVIICINLIVAAVVFFLTEDLRNPIRIFDKWSILMGILVIVAFGIYIVEDRKESDKDSKKEPADTPETDLQSDADNEESGEEDSHKENNH